MMEAKIVPIRMVLFIDHPGLYDFGTRSVEHTAMGGRWMA